MNTEPLKLQINKMRQTACTLTALKNKIKDNLVAITIILSLPPSYSTLQTILMSEDAQSTEGITAKILAKESHRQETAAQSAFMAKFHSMCYTPCNGEGQAGSSTQSSENRTKVCGWIGYMVGDLRTNLGHGDVWIGVPVQCYTGCNKWPTCWNGSHGRRPIHPACSSNSTQTGIYLHHKSDP